ncbi:MAG: hypothetical protein KDD02_22090 [Phaeodactylibacter sp.]|nr:hypothetical protein [Phaeodactylibacter sp.]
MNYPLQHNNIQPDIPTQKAIKSLGIPSKKVTNPQYFDASLRDTVKKSRNDFKVELTHIINKSIIQK